MKQMATIIIVLLMFPNLINTSVNINIKDLYRPNASDPELTKATGYNKAKLAQCLGYIRQREQVYVSGFQSQYHIIPQFIKENNYKIGAEVGIAFGTHSMTMLQETGLEKLYSIDPFKHFPKSIYPDGMNLEQDYFNVLHFIVKKRLEVFGERSELIRKRSIDAASQFEDNSLDIIYFDGNHTYNNVIAELRLYYPKIKPGGIISGDDYGNSSHTGVKKAVDQFFKEKNLQITVFGSMVWWVKKPYQ